LVVVEVDLDWFLELLDENLGLDLASVEEWRRAREGNRDRCQITI